MTSFCVIIPTRNRYRYLRFALQSALRQTHSNLTVVVSDNNSTDGTREYLHSISDSRLRYVNPGRDLSMTDNWNFALDHAQGDFFVLIGDDDYLMPSMLEEAGSVISSDPSIDIVAFARDCAYQYPMPNGEGNGCTWIPRTRYSECYVDSRDYAQGWFNFSGWVGHTSGTVFRRELAGRARYEGQLFHPPCPDVYAFPILSSLARKIYYFHRNRVLLSSTPVSSTVLHVADESSPGHPDHPDPQFGDPVAGEFPGYSMLNTALRALAKAKQHFPEQTADLEINMETYFRTASRQYASHWVNGVVSRHTLKYVMQHLSTRRRIALLIDLGLAATWDEKDVRRHIRRPLAVLRRQVLRSLLIRLGLWHPALEFHQFGTEVQDIEGCWDFLKDKV